MFMSKLISIHGIDDDAHAKTPSNRPGTAASSIRKESTIGEAEDEREEDAEPTTPIQQSVRGGRTVESESVSSAIDTSESVASMLPTSPKTESDTDVAATAVTAAVVKAKMCVHSIHV